MLRAIETERRAETKTTRGWVASSGVRATVADGRQHHAHAITDEALTGKAWQNRLARRPAPAPAEPMKRFTIDVPACLPKLIGLDNLAPATKRRQVQTDAWPHARGETAQRLTARPVR